MTGDAASDSVLAALRSLRDRSGLPTHVSHAAARLLARLQRPVQILILGPPDSGKSTLADLLVGHPIYRTLSDLPNFTLAYGERARILAPRPGQPPAPSADPQGLGAAGADLARVEMPLPILRTFSIAEISLTDPTPPQYALADWAYDRADIALWCSQSFDAPERALWARARSSLKDNSCLVLAKADRLLAENRLNALVAQLSPSITEDFYGLYTVATEEALKARDAPPEADAQGWKTSGGQRLRDAVLRLVQIGLQADRDHAELLMTRYARSLDKDLPVDRRRSRQPDGLRSDTPDRPVAEKRPLTAGDGADAPGLARTALHYLQTRAEDLQRAVRDQPDLPATALSHAIETAEELLAILQRHPVHDTHLQRLRDEILQGTGRMTRQQREDDEGGAFDAVTFLLQIKRDLGQQAQPRRHSSRSR